MGNKKRISIRFDERTLMLIDELSSITGMNASVIIRSMTMRCIEELIDKSGNWTVDNAKNKNRKS